jgi:hypothetical protein
MTLARQLPSLSIVAIAILLGLAACKPAADAAAAAPPVDSPEPAGTASASEHAAATMDAINPMTSPREAVIASMHRLMGARSYHTSMRIDGGPRGALDNEVDFVAPDRFRMDMKQMGTQVVVGNTMYMSMRGKTMQVQMPKGTLDKWRDPGNFREAEAGMTAEGMGSETLDGVSTQKYTVHYTLPQPGDSTLWIDDDGLPVQMRVTLDNKGTPVTTTLRYSRVNDPTLRIEAPK